MKAVVTVHIEASDLVNATDTGEAIMRARRVAERIGTPGDGEVMSSLFDDGFRITFPIDPIAANA